MSLIPRNQITGFESMLDDLFGNLPVPAARSFWPENFGSMRVDIHEDEGEYEIKADLPGVKKEDISIALENDILTISARKESEKEEKKRGRVIRRERSTGEFTRSFSVDRGIREKDIKARFEDGVLTITMPKPKEQPEKGAKRITVN